MNKIKEITQHGQDVMLFNCDKCNHTVSIDTLDVLTAEDHLHCPVCGAGHQHLFLIENDDKFEKLEKQLAEIDRLLFINYSDFKPAQIFFNKKGDEYLIYDFIRDQTSPLNWCKYLEASQIDELKKLIIEYIGKRY